MDTRFDTTNDAELGIAKLKIAFNKVFQEHATKRDVINIALDVIGKMKDNEIQDFIKRYNYERV